MDQQIQDDDSPGHNDEKEGVTEFLLAVSPTPFLSAPTYTVTKPVRPMPSEKGESRSCHVFIPLCHLREVCQYFLQVKCSRGQPCEQCTTAGASCAYTLGLKSRVRRQRVTLANDM